MIGIYKITNQLNGKSYIGQSIHIEQRWIEHQYNSSKCSLLRYALQKYGIQNFTFEVIEECSQDELDEKEIYWISYYGTFENGYNLTRGGNSGFKYDINAVYEDYLQTNNIAKTAKNIGCHTTTARNILHEFGVNGYEQQLEKPIECIDPKTLQVISQYSSIQDAADAFKINRALISNAANGKKKSAGGYFWRFIGENKQFELGEVKRYKEPVQQLDYYTGEILAEYESAREAAERLTGSRSAGGRISEVCNGKLTSALGFKWKRTNDKNYVFNPPKQKIKKWNQKVLQIDIKTNKIIGSYKSYAEAARAINKSSKSGADKISQVCRGLKESAYGFKWKNASTVAEDEE